MVGKVTRSAIDRFEEKIERVTDSGCWIWIGGTAGQGGYGVMHFKGRQQYSHRISWMLFRGPIQDGMVVMHRCDNPACVNPEHLRVGTLKDNTQDMLSKRRHRVSPAFGKRNGAHTHPERVLRGSASGASKLTEDQVSRIREKCDGGARQIDVANEFNVSVAAINRIVRRKLWLHVL